VFLGPPEFYSRRNETGDHVETIQQKRFGDYEGANGRVTAPAA
jgi:hypothetical protein